MLLFDNNQRDDHHDHHHDHDLVVKSKVSLVGGLYTHFFVDVTSSQSQKNSLLSVSVLRRPSRFFQDRHSHSQKKEQDRRSSRILFSFFFSYSFLLFFFQQQNGNPGRFSKIDRYSWAPSKKTIHWEWNGQFVDVGHHHHPRYYIIHGYSKDATGIMYLVLRFTVAVVLL